MEQWRIPISVEDQDGMTRGIESELARYYTERDKPAPYIPPSPTPPAPVFTMQTVTRIAAPLGVAVALVSAVAVVVVSVVSICGAVSAFVSANAMLIGGGALAVGFIASLFVGRSAAKDTPGPVSSPGDEYEFYQRMEQGWRKKGSK